MVPVSELVRMRWLSYGGADDDEEEAAAAAAVVANMEIVAKASIVAEWPFGGTL